MMQNGKAQTVSELEGRLDLQLADLVEAVFRFERDWRQADHIDNLIRYTR